METHSTELLDELDVLHRERRETEARTMMTVLAFAHQHGAETVDPVEARLPGRQRAVLLGGEGTPKVAEFAPALIAGRLQLSTYAAGRLVADVLDLAHRLPQIWQRVQALEVREMHARLVARRTRELTPEQAAQVDERVAESADGRLPWHRFCDLVDAAVVAADVDKAAEREQQAATEVFAKPTRSTEHGMRGFYLRADLGTVAQLDAAVSHLAEALRVTGDPGTLDERRVRSMRLLANPAKAIATLHVYADLRAGRVPPAGVHRLVPDDSTVLPTIELHVHLDRQGAETGAGVARIEGERPLSAQWVRRSLGPRCRFRIRPVLDPLSETPVDSWEIPKRHRRAVHVLTPADTFPFAQSTDRQHLQIDHTRPFDPHGPPGQSRIGNYGPMTAFHHRLKTHAGWRVEQPFPGLYVWRDPSGATYLVDASGTRRLDEAVDTLAS